MVYYQPQAQPFLSPVVPHFKIEVSKPLEKEEAGVVLLETDLADEVDIIELTEAEGLECLAEGSFPHPVYCDKYYTCTDQAGELKVSNIFCSALSPVLTVDFLCSERGVAV